MSNKRGKLLVIEGTDCSGKSTQIDLLTKRLREEGYSVTTLDFPDYTSPTGKVVRRYLENEFGQANDVNPKLASTLYALDRHNSKPILNKALEENDVVIMDRYVESNLGHQGGKVKDKEKREKLFEWLTELEYEDLELPKPDQVLILRMPHKVSMELRRDRERKSQDHPDKSDGHESSKQHLKNAEKAYLHLAEFYDCPVIECAPDETIDSLKKPEEIHQEVWQHVEPILKYLR